MSDPVPSYHALHFIVRYGGWLAWLAPAAVAAGSVVASRAFHAPLYLALGVVLSALGYLVARSYVELVRVIVDMLLPK